MQQFKGVDESTQVLSKQTFDIEKLYNEYKAGSRTSPFPVAFLRDVVCRPMVNSKKHQLLEGVSLAPNAKPTVDQVTPESLRWVLDFKFESKDGLQAYTETLWDIESEDEKYNNKQNNLIQRYAQFYEAFCGSNTAAAALSTEKIFGKNKQSWENYFKGIADIFNKNGENNTPVYRDKPVRIKLVRNRGNKQNPNDVQMPFGNVIEPYVQGTMASLLQVKNGEEFHIVEKPKSQTFGVPDNNSGFGSQPGGQSTDTVPDKGEWGDL